MENFELNGTLNEYIKISEPTTYDNGYLEAKVTNALTYKYPDEVSTIKTLKGLDAAQFVEETINTKRLNDYIKKNKDSEITKTLITEKLAEPAVTVKLSVSRVD